MRTGILFLSAAVCLAAQTIEPQKLKEDLTILYAALQEGHPGIYRYTPKPQLDAVFAHAAAQIDHPMTALEFFRIASPAVAVLKCGHTRLRPPEQIENRLFDSMPLLPIDVRILSGKVFVFRDLTDGKLAGAEILAINGVTSAKLLATMLANVGGDGDTPTAGPNRLGQSHLFRIGLYAYSNIEPPYRIEYRLHGKMGVANMDGTSTTKARELDVTRYPEDDRPKFGATYRFDGKTSTGVLRVYQFGGSAEDGKPLQQFFQQSYEDLDRRHARNLIIDVRDNGGGEDELGKLLFSYLVTEPFPYYNDLAINKLTFDFFRYVDHPRPLPENAVEKRPNGKYLLNSHPNWGIQKPGTPHFAGNVYALMNGGSFSTTCEFLSTLHYHRRAVFIGEEAAGGYYGNTSGPGTMLVLPNSKVRIYVRLMTYYMAIPGEEHGKRSIPPDHPLTYTIDEMLDHKDKEMAEAYRLIESANAAKPR